MDPSVISLVLIIVVLTLIYRRLTRRNDYFHDKPIPSMAVQPGLGSTGPLILHRVSFNDFIYSIYNKYPGVKVFGLFDLTTPMFVLRDPELIKAVGVKDFDHFVDRRQIFGDCTNDSPDVYFNKMLVMLTGQRWRDMRATLSPAFTGSKMRLMLNLMTDYCGQAIPILKQQALDNGGYLNYEMKELFNRMGNDIIATCAFGLQVESIGNKTNNFYMMGKQLTNMNRWKPILKAITMRLFPSLLNKFNIDIFDQEQTHYFADIIREAVRTREAKGIVRPDMIQMLMQAQKGTLKHVEESHTESEAGFATVQESNVGKQSVAKSMTEPELIAQCLIFFLAGFDSISTMLMFMSYELALHPEIQQCLYEEVRETHNKLEGEPINYETLQQMKYMDMVVSETLRFWVPAAIDRLCIKDYTLDDGNGLKFTIEKGTAVWFPSYGIHHDPKYYPNPEVFDPERFSDANRRNINMDAYLPFGVGPRNCIGSRFALMEMKALIYAVLLEFKLERTEETQVPLKMAKGFVSIQSEKGVHLRVQLRNQS
ncbi:cytochrome P450 9e2-like [Uranotaenia lowii]|uniref:cytochrome P450 9e2-like n=1 Tax=Uranotaenia lowii TaxID=190385 RepID=UPI002479CB73|nr:cytochrome P450 9e2-like [Uranotaenia lowii]